MTISFIDSSLRAIPNTIVDVCLWLPKKYVPIPFSKSKLSSEWIQSILNQTEKWGNPQLKDITKIERSLFLRPYEYSKISFYLTVRKIHFFVKRASGKETIEEIASQVKAEAEKTFGNKQSEVCYNILEEKTKEALKNNASNLELSKTQFCGYLAEGGLKILASSAFYLYAASWVSSAIIVDYIPYFQTAATITILYGWIVFTTQGKREELASLKPSIKDRVTELFNKEVKEEVLKEAKKIFDVDDDNDKLKSFKKDLETIPNTLNKKASTDPFPSLKKVSFNDTKKKDKISDDEGSEEAEKFQKKLNPNQKQNDILVRNPNKWYRTETKKEWWKK